MERKRYLEIDYLRVLSMFGVFLIHTYSYINIEIIQKIVLKLGIGNMVACFFVISGFLAFASADGENARKYYMNRVLRIYLVYWITFHINLYIYCFLLKQLEFNWWRYFVGILGLQMAIPSHNYMWNGLGAGGALSAFIVFYLLVPIFRKKIRTKEQAFCTLFGGIVLCNLIRYVMTYTLTGYGDSGKWVAYYSPQSNMWYFLVGIVLWFIKDKVKMKYILIEVLGIIMSLVMENRYDTYAFYSCCTALGLSIYWMCRKGELPYIKGTKFWVKIGYAFWLVHPIVLTLLQTYCERMKYVSEKCEYFDWLLILGLSLAGAWLLTEISNQIVKRSNVKWMDS